MADTHKPTRVGELLEEPTGYRSELDALERELEAAEARQNPDAGLEADERRAWAAWRKGFTRRLDELASRLGAHDRKLDNIEAELARVVKRRDR